VQSVPDGLAAGVLAGVNPLAGLYAYLFGTISGALSTSSVFMAVQATGAMSIILTDIPAVHAANEQAGALVTSGTHAGWSPSTASSSSSQRANRSGNSFA